MKFQGSQGSNPDPIIPQSDVGTSLRDVLVIDADPRTCDALRRALGDRPVRMRYAPSSEQAELEMRRQAADLMLVNVQINDNMGLELLTRLRRRFPQTDAVAMSRNVNHELCLRAWRAGAVDLITTPLTPTAVADCVSRVEHNRLAHEKLRARNRRLRTVCRQLNKARHEISQQVNLLCHDLVKAYQDLAQQLNQAQQSGDFAVALGNEVEIETLLRRTMEWVLKKIGPVNAAVFLPDSEQNYALGAFLNYDTAAESMLIDVVSNTIVKQAAGASAPLAIEQNHQLEELFGKDAALLLNRKWLACPAYYRSECLAVLVVFQNQGEPLPENWSELLEMACPVLGERIARSVRVYQRGLGSMNDDTHDHPSDDDDVGV